MADYYVGSDGVVKKKKKKTASEYRADSKGNVSKASDDIAPVKPTVNVASTKPADKITSLMSVYGNKDFATKSGYVSTKSEGIWEKLGSKYGMNYNDLQYEYINNQNDIRKEIDSKAVSWGSDTGKTSSSYKEKALDYMTEDEVAVYNYYYQTEGKDKAQEFLDALAETLNARKAGKDFESIEGKTAREILYGTVAGAEQFKQGVKGFGSMITGKDDYIPQTSTQILTGKIREDLADDGTKVFGNSLGQVVHDALSTGTNMLPSVMTGGVAGTILMGATAAGNAYQQDLNEFGDKEKARIYATTIGALEGTLQHFMGGIGQLGGTSAAISNAVSGVKNGALRFALEYGGKIGSEALEEGLQEVLDPVVKNWTHGTDESVDWENVAYSALLGGLMGGVFGATEVSSTHLNANENAVVDKVYNDTIAEREADGKKLSQKEKAKIYDETIKKLEKGYIDTDTIESVLGGETYNNLKSVTENETKLQEEYDALNKMKLGEMTGEQTDRKAELKKQLEELKNSSENSKENLKSQLDSEMLKVVEGTKLSESYNERSRRSQVFEADLTKYDTKQQDVIKKAAESGILNNTNRTHEFVDMIAKISADKGVSFDFTNNVKLKETGFALEGKTVNGYVKDGNIAVNIDSTKALNTVVGHEITHVLEGTDLYTELQNVVKEYAAAKGEYDTRYEVLKELYKDVDGAVIENELTDDLVGEYLFTDSDFVSRLSVEKPNIFKKIYEEIKYLYKVATGTKEAIQLEKLKRTFDKAYKASANAPKDINTVYSLFVDENIVKKAEEFKRDGYINFERIKITDVTDRIKADVEKLVGFDASGYEIYSTTDTFKHIEKRHGENGKHDQSMKDMRDVALMGYVLNNYDNAELVYNKDGKPEITYAYSDKNGKPSKLIKFSKEIDGIQYVVVAAPENKYKKLWVLSEYKEQKKDTSQPSNDNTVLPPTSETHSDNVSSKDIISDSSKNASNIRYSLSDTKGRNLTEEQQNYFKDSKVRDENGSLKVMYHGSPAQFTVFDKKKAKSSGFYGRGFYFSESESHAGQYGGRYEVYLDLKNPVQAGTKNITKEQLRKFVAEIAENEDYGIENYGYDATVDSVTNSVYGKDDFTMLGDLNATSIGDMVEAIQLFNEVNRTNYDGIIASTETVAFYPEQIKNIGNQNPTDNPDINLSLGEESAQTGDYRVYGKDIALEAHTQETAQEGVAEIAPTTSIVEEMPIRSDYAPPQEYMSAEPEVAPVVEEVTPAAEDNERILGEDLTKKNADRIRTIQAEIKGHHLTKDITKKEFDEKIAQKESQYESLSRKDTKKAVDLRNQITRLETKRDSLLRGLDGKIERANKRIESIENESRFAKRNTKQNEYRELFGKLMGDTSTWKDKKMGIQYQTNTFHRNLRDIVRDASGNQDIARADAIYDELQGSVNRNEAKKNREANEVKNVFREMKINNSESTYIQMLGELRHNPDTTLTKDVVDEFYKKNKGKIDVQKVDKAIDEARKLYDSLYDRVNAALSDHGFKEIGYRKGYFPHFTDPKRNWLAKLLNWKVNNDEIPTDIAGLTEMFEPQRTWQSFDKHRKTDTTDYNFLKGLDNYVNGSLDWIYHIEDIQKHRAFENEIRYRHSSEQVQKKIDEYRNNPMLSTEEVDTLIQSALREAKNPLNNFVTDLHTRTNILAGKKSSKDRNMESDFNRHAYSVMTNITNRVTANQVVGSISSAMTNFIPITQSWGQVNPTSSLVGMKKTIQSYMSDDGVTAKSDFLTNRLAQNEALYKDAWDKIGDKVGGLMEIVDNFTSQTVWRSKYYENIKNGMTEAQAIKDADQFAENVIGGRSKGNMPTIFHAKNPVTKMLTAFQLEVANQYGYIFKDMPQDIGEKAIGKLTKGYATMFVGAYAYNALFSALTGRDSALDPIGIIQDFIRDLTGDDDEEEDVTGAIGNLASNIADEIPFVGGLLGGGRIPISSALPYNASISDAYTDVVDGDWKSVLDELSKPLYYGVMPMGGGQIRKTVQGLSMFDKDLPVSGSYTKSGNLRFPVEDTFLNKLQAGVFGQYASSNAREYFDRGQAPLKEKQIQEYKDVGLPISEYWDYREGLKKQEKLEDKFEYISDLDVSDKQKNILINNVVDRKEKVDMSNYDDFANYEEFDFYSKNTEKYNFLQDNGISYSEYKSDEETKKEYDNIYSWYKNNPEKVTLSKAVTNNVIEYRRYASDLDDIRADKDSSGKTISGSSKKKKTEYINSLDLDYGQRIILYRSLFDSNADKAAYNADIVEYLNSRDDITYEEMVTILESLDMKVLSDGTVAW